MKRITIFLLALIFLVACSDRLNITITNPNVEQQFHEQALATAQPRFSWNYETTENEVVQQNYRIIVASTAENAQNGIGDLWDSGVVPLSQMLYIPYAGKELKSRDKAYWKVITTIAAKGKKAKVESDVKSFEISLLNQEDWQAKWIGHEFEYDVWWVKPAWRLVISERNLPLTATLKKLGFMSVEWVSTALTSTAAKSHQMNC